MNRNRYLWLVAGLLGAAVLSGCAQDVGTIDRTQHNIVEKKDVLDKEFYFRVTVVKSPFAAAQSTIGDQGRLERGIFEIQESYVHFFRTYEWMEGSEYFGNKADTDTPLLDAEGKPVTYEACVDGAERVYDVARCKDRGGDVDGAVKQVGRWVYRGAPLASFPIESHFDVIRSYNPTTGERTNVIVEDTQDRQWFERSSMRVNWGNPKLANFGLLMMMTLRQQYPDIAGWSSDESAASGEIVSALSGSAMVIYKGEADEPRNQPRFVYRNVSEDQQTLEYMDFVSAWILPAATVFYEDWNADIPLCWFYPWYAGGIFECTTEEYSVRTSFLEVPQNDTYASVDYDDTMLEKFGYYRAERQNYDREYGSTYHDQIQKAFLHPIWEAGRDENGAVLPETQRTPKPLVYYMSERYPREIVDESVELANQWNEPFESVVEFYKGAKWYEEIGLTADLGHMFVLCENSNADAQAAFDAGAEFFAPGDAPGTNVNAVAFHGIQGQPGYNPRCLDMENPKYNGDLRYNILHAVIEPQQNGLLGFGPPSADPLTGRIVNANAYNYYAQMKLYAHKIMDVIEVLAGVRELNDYMSARYIKEDMKAKRARIETNDPNLTTSEAIALASAIVAPDVAERVMTGGLPKDDQGGSWAQARLGIIESDPTLERMLVDDSVRMLFRDPTVGLDVTPSPKTLAKMSPRTWGHWGGFKRQMQFEQAAGALAADTLGFADPAIGGIVRQYRVKYDQAACEHFRERTDLVFDYGDFESLKVDASTESGHCAVAGEVNDEGWTCEYVDHQDYKGNYWVNSCTTEKLLLQISRELRIEEGTDGRAYWPLNPLYTDSRNPKVSATQDEMKTFLALKRDEYVSEILQEMYLAIATHEVGHNLGLRHNFTASTDAMNYPREYWDLKAGKTPGSAASTFVNGLYKPSTADYLWQRETRTQEYNNLRQLQTSSVMDYGHKFNSEFEGVGLYDKAAVKFGYGQIVEAFRTSPNLQKYIQKGYLQSPETGAPSNHGLEFRSADQMEELFKRVHYTNIPNAFGSTDGALDLMYDREDYRWEDLPSDKQEVPYRYCEGDRLGEDPWCWTRDSGADPFEIVVNAMADHDDYDWFVSGYGHDSALFWPDNYYNLTRGRFQLAKLQFQWWTLNYSYFNHNDWWKTGPGKGAGPNGEDLAWHEDPNGGLGGTLASYVGFSKVAGAFGRPEPGYYGYNQRRNRYEAVQDLNQDGLQHQFRIYEDGGARPFYAGWSNEGYDVYPVRAGSIYDRMAAFEVLSDPSTDFIGIDEEADTQRYKISFYSMFPRESLRLLGGLMTGEVEGYGWCVKYDRLLGYQSLRQRDFLTGETCGEGEAPLDPEPTSYTFPTTKYRIPMLAAYYGMSLMITDYNRSFMDVSRIFLQGHASAVDLPADVEKVTFEHPFTGKIYVAYKTGLENEYTPAWYLVNEANVELEKYRLGNGTIDVSRLAAEYDRSPLEFATGKLELVRAMHALYDYTREGTQTAAGGQ